MVSNPDPEATLMYHSSMSMSLKLDDRDIVLFKEQVYNYFREHGRRFAWRETRDPYHILVSEFMLQQTQTTRVINVYPRFLHRFPDFQTLSQASTSDVLSQWQGLGYNRRALALRETARQVTRVHGGQLPSDREALTTLPGVGKYTAAAIRVFAFEQPEVLIETNIRTVIIHHFFPQEEQIKESELLPLIEATLDASSPRTWYYALMDYGAMLKKQDNAARRSSRYRRQSAFAGSRREARSILLRTLLDTGITRKSDLVRQVDGWSARFDDALQTLCRDGLVYSDRGTLRIAD